MSQFNQARRSAVLVSVFAWECLACMISFSPVAGAQSVPIEVLYNFPEGLQEPGNVVEPGNLVEGPDHKFYGFTVYGGLNHRGTLFRMDTNGVVTTLFNFGGVN